MPDQEFKPFVPADSGMKEFTFKSIILGSIFGILFGAATVYLALRAGLTVSASIPIAVIAITLGRWLFKTTILENNIIQTTGSAGESVAGGVAFTLPGFLFLSIGSNGPSYFNYITIFVLAIIGGILGTLMIDSTKTVRRYLWRDAKVVYNTVNSERNYLQINRGAKYGIKDNMAVLSSDGAAVGVVVNVSPNFSEVMSLLHVQNSVSASLKSTGDAGKVEWDAKDPKYVVLKGISKSVPVKIGDTVLTSRYSYNFPPDKMIGTVAGIGSDPASGLYLLKVKTAVNFSNIQQVFVVENLQREEQVQLEKDTEKKYEQQKRNTH